MARPIESPLGDRAGRRALRQPLPGADVASDRHVALRPVRGRDDAGAPPRQPVPLDPAVKAHRSS